MTSQLLQVSTIQNKNTKSFCYLYLNMADHFPNRAARKEKDDRPLTRAQKDKIIRDFNKPIIVNDPPRAITENDAKFFFIILNAMDSVPDVNWDLVADRAGYDNATAARIRYGQVRRQLRLYYAKAEPKVAPYYNTLMIPQALNGPSKSDKDKGTTDPLPAKVVRRKASKPGPGQKARTKPTKFPRNHGQGLIINRNDEMEDPVQPRYNTEFKRIEAADERDEYDSENEYQNHEEFDLSTYKGFNIMNNTITLSDQGDTDDEQPDDVDHTMTAEA
ncbi:hypothetical protein DSL72_005287 [Monilinia vaccinii-corymbosi]|uniref:Uncharacterized protein n=1 Tax=Monilinia vaccinii-corymbosi TaxID=61207 RepID=A0A8A3PFA2_9HELO|nr:hypothetical protein DSL72_005287 [Monilinia vaccinii-corymbosi]